MNCNKKELSDIFGVTERHITDLQRLGLPHVKGKIGEHNSYDTAAVHRWLIARARGNGAARTTDEQRRELLKVKTEIAKLDLGERTRELLRADQAVAAWSNLVLAFRNRTLLIPTKVALELEHKTTVEIHDALTREIHEALMGISNFRLEDVRDAP